MNTQEEQVIRHFIYLNVTIRVPASQELYAAAQEREEDPEVYISKTLEELSSVEEAIENAVLLPRQLIGSDGALVDGQTFKPTIVDRTLGRLESIGHPANEVLTDDGIERFMEEQDPSDPHGIYE